MLLPRVKISKFFFQDPVIFVFNAHDIKSSNFANCRFSNLLSLFIVWVFIRNCPIQQIIGLRSAHQITFMANWRVHSWSTLGTHLDNIWNTFVTHLEQISSTLWTNWKDFCNTSLQCWWNQEDVVVQSIFVGKAEVCVVLNCKSSSSRGNTVLVRGTCASLSGEKTCACS